MLQKSQSTRPWWPCRPTQSAALHGQKRLEKAIPSYTTKVTKEGCKNTPLWRLALVTNVTMQNGHLQLYLNKLCGPCPHNSRMCSFSMPSSSQNDLPLLFCTTAFSAEGDVSTLSMKSSNLLMCASCILRHGGPGWVDFHFQISNDESCSSRSRCSKSTICVICGSFLAAVDWAVATAFVVVQPMVESIKSRELKGKCLLQTSLHLAFWRVFFVYVIWAVDGSGWGRVKSHAVLQTSVTKPRLPSSNLQNLLKVFSLGSKSSSLATGVLCK